MPLGIPDTRAFPWDESLKSHLGQLNNGVTGGINTWGVPPTVGSDGLALGANQVGYTGINTSNSTLDRWNGTSWSTVMFGSKLVTTPQLNVYVNQATGNDANDGMTASTAWKTISKFYQEVSKYNLLSRQTNLYLGAGTYTIEFPPSLWGTNVRVLGASNATVTIQRMQVDKGTNVFLQDVTLAFPQLLDSNLYHWAVSVNNLSVLYLGPNIILGKIGNYIVGAHRYHVHVSAQSQVYFTAGNPITLTSDVNSISYLRESSSIVNLVYDALSAGTSQPNLAPALDTGALYTSWAPLTAANTTCIINAVGSITVGALFILTGASRINGSPNWKLLITGSISGSAYALYSSSFISGFVVKGAAPALGIGFPTSISSGTADATSYTQGAPF